MCFILLWQLQYIAHESLQTVIKCYIAPHNRAAAYDSDKAIKALLVGNAKIELQTSAGATGVWKWCG